MKKNAPEALSLSSICTKYQPYQKAKQRQKQTKVSYLRLVLAESDSEKKCKSCQGLTIKSLKSLSILKDQKGKMFNVQGNLPLCLMLISPLPFSLLYNALKNGKIVKHNQWFVLLFLYCNRNAIHFISDTLISCYKFFQFF